MTGSSSMSPNENRCWLKGDWKTQCPASGWCKTPDPSAKQAEVDKMLKYMKDGWLIKESDSPWSYQSYHKEEWRHYQANSSQLWI
jgi:hypothetical protein